jgi:iodotyrosine deiodinase
MDIGNRNRAHPLKHLPSGANQQPWRFVAVSDGALKRRIREAAEAEARRRAERRKKAEQL